ncbi:MAG: hypothetical protein ACOYXC_16415 [Candidatus Rifleibacteriota bacterium]
MGVTGRLEENLVIFTLEGENTVDQAKKAFSSVFSVDNLEGNLPVLVDARNSQRNRGLSEVAGFAEALLHYREMIGSKCALVISEQRQNPLGLERSLAAFSLREKIQFGLFFDLESARSWLKES